MVAGIGSGAGRRRRWAFALLGLALAVGLALSAAVPAAHSARERSKLSPPGLPKASSNPYVAGAPVPGAAPAGGELVLDRDGAGRPYVAGELIVTYAQRASGSEIKAANQAVEARVEDSFEQIDARALEFPEVKRLDSRAQRELELGRLRRELVESPEVAGADYNYVYEPAAIVNDPFYPRQWGLHRIRAPQAWSTSVGAGTLIGVLDTGIQASHPDIGGIVADADFYNGDPVAEDNVGHGTHVAGIAGAITDNGTGVAGTSPLGSFLIAKVCDLSGCPVTAIVNGLIASADFGGVDVINMSLGGPGCPLTMRNAVNYAAARGIVLVAAAGNDASSVPSCPAAYDNVIAVSGTDRNNGDSDFSNYGSWIDVAAPGGEDASVKDAQDIFSTVPTDSYAYKNGTSMASPFVAGVASLLAARGHAAGAIRSRILGTATDLGSPGKDVLFGHGLVNAEAALRYAPPPTPPSPSPAPSPPTSGGDGGSAAPSGATKPCAKAKRKLRRAKKGLRAAKRSGEAARIKQAKRKLRKAKKRRRRAC